MHLRCDWPKSHWQIPRRRPSEWLPALHKPALRTLPRGSSACTGGHGLPEQRQEPADQRPSTRPLGAARGTCKSAPHPSRWRRRSLQPDQVGLGRDGPPRCGRGWWYHRKTISWMDVAWCPMFWTAGYAIRFDWLGQPRTAQALQWKERDTQWSPFFSRSLARWRSRLLSHAHDDTAAHFTLHKSVGSFDGT